MEQPKRSGPKPFVFVLMPFKDDFNDTYQFGIKAAAEEAGAYAERVDEQYFQGSILERIWNQIAKADVVVADMSERNPNVFYEVGYAHALGKVTLLLTQQADDIPFDLKHWPHIVYGGSIERLRRELMPWLEWALGEARKQNLLGASWNLEVSLADVPMARSPDEAKWVRITQFPVRYDDEYPLDFVLRNRGSANSPVIDDCYIWCSHPVIMGRDKGKMGIRPVEIPYIRSESPDNWSGKRSFQYKLAIPFRGKTIPPGGFETIHLVQDVSAIVEREDENELTVYRLVFRVILGGLPQDFFLEYSLETQEY